MCYGEMSACNRKFKISGRCKEKDFFNINKVYLTCEMTLMLASLCVFNETVRVDKKVFFSFFD